MPDNKIPVDCIVHFDLEGNPTPLKIRFEDNDEQHIIRIGKVTEREEKKGFGSMNGNSIRQFLYKCESIIEGLAVPFKLQFENKTCKWHLNQK